MRLIALDTATERCSVALWLDGAVQTREVPRAGAASEGILCLIDQLLAESGVALGSLEAVAFGRGPGAFTGVRLAAGVAQGLAFAADLPVLPVSDLKALAQQAFKHHGTPARALVCQDARMGEVYWGCFERLGGSGRYGRHARHVGPEAVGPPSSVQLPRAWGERACDDQSADGHARGDPAWEGPASEGPASEGPASEGPAWESPAWEGQGCCAAGSGFEAHALLADLPGIDPACLWPALRPRALEIAELAAAAGLAAAVPPEQALPVYLRDDVAARTEKT
jgi:tRNA threonylcarbamoyladenosine biosynthesis protein TsaB